MRSGVGVAALVALASGACAYYPVPPDPIRIVNSPAEVSTCRRLAPVGYARTDGVGQVLVSQLTTPVRAPVPGPNPYAYGPAEIVGPNFAVRVNVMRDAALQIGASDLLLTRRVYRDWSYVEGTAYLCRH